MADITVKGQNFLGVPDVTFQKVGGGTATFYENGGDAPNLQTKNKTYNPTESQQTEQVKADNGYDGLDEVNVTVGAISSSYVGSGVPRKNDTDIISVYDDGVYSVNVPAGYYQNQSHVNVPGQNLPSAMSGSHTGTLKATIFPNTSGDTYLNIPTGYNGEEAYYRMLPLMVAGKTITSNGTYLAEDDDLHGFSSVIVNVSGTTSKNVQIAQGVNRTNSTSYTAISGQSITVAKTGTYDVYWSGFRSSTGGTNGSQLYIGETAYGTAQTTFSNHGQSVHLENVSLTSGQTISVRARARGTSYYMYVANLTIIEKI